MALHLRVLACDVSGGTSVEDAIRDAIKLAQSYSVPGEPPIRVAIKHNSVLITVEPDSNPTLICRDYDRASTGCIQPNIPPHPKAELTDADRKNDSRVTTEGERRLRPNYREMKQREVTARLAEAPAIELADESVWTLAGLTNKDEQAIAETWARLMQLKLADGKRLEEVMAAAADDAGLNTVNNQYRMTIVHMLAEAWKHGPQLQEIHNRYWALYSQGETINPSSFVSLQSANSKR